MEINPVNEIWFSKLQSDEKDSTDPFQLSGAHDRHVFGKPREIGFFSIDSSRQLLENKSQMKYLVFPLKMRDLEIDLNVNCKLDVFHYYNTIEKMYQTLKWLSRNQKKLQTLSKKTDFVTVRGALVKIMCTPYLKGCIRPQWEICATRYEGVIYFCAIDSDEDIEENKNATPKQLMFQSWGYKFEQYMTTSEIGSKPDVSSTTHQLEEFCIMLENIFNEHTLIYKAEVDAVIPYRYPGPGSGDTSCYTELKTSRTRTRISAEMYFYRNKLLNWWTQSYLAGIPEVICGMRDDLGIVNSLEVIRISNMPNLAQGFWSPDVCLHFCDYFLNYLKKTVIEDDPNLSF
ncbi:decapping and exoribonuclease protein-like isoform X2 [Uloborus diversus]|uniref:decapping and exoribonuclease protein-like isoform X2 n=1 Tax=Uloborus diversus TaxID=327109 RepID=UPI002409C0E3|nr:decapping and exoribonuclease protein-like isoform X2 [Uloborus diversus]